MITFIQYKLFNVRGMFIKKIATNGKCVACLTDFSKKTALRHLSSCDKLQVRLDKSQKKEEAFIIKVQFPYAVSVYWMYLLLPKILKLKKLDKFLRDVWLECCGHMSAFNINGYFYSSSPVDDERSMNISCDRILVTGLKFRHEYDFGSTTELQLEVINEWKAAPQKDVMLLMKNNPPAYPCSECRQTSVHVCTHCGDTLCKACVQSHGCVEEEDYMISVLANSPRAGVCGYEG